MAPGPAGLERGLRVSIPTKFNMCQCLRAARTRRIYQKALVQHNGIFLGPRRRSECSCGWAFSDSAENRVSLPSPEPGVPRSPFGSLTGCLRQIPISLLSPHASGSYFSLLYGLKVIPMTSFFSFISIATPLPDMFTF